MKAQAARAVGTVATKLGSGIQPEIQARLLTLLVVGLEGRTWTGKESIINSLAELVKSGPEVLRSNMVKEEQDKMVESILRESRKEKTEYKKVALKSTGRILSELKVDRLKEIYEIVEGYLPKLTESDKQEEEEEEADPERADRQLEVLESALECLGLSWPASGPSAELYLPIVLEQLESLATNTTRRNQLALVRCMANILKVATIPTASSMKVFTKLAVIISSLLQVPKYVQLRTETLQVLD